MTDDAREKPTEAEFREYVFGKLPRVEHRDVHRHVGLIDDADVRAYVSFAASVYEPLAEDPDMPNSFWETDFAEEVLPKYGTDTGTEALKRGNIGQLQFFSGLVGYKTDVSGMQALMALQKMIEDAPVFIAYIYGLMGSGKSNFAMLLLEVFASVYGEDNVYRAANITSDSVDEEIREYRRVVNLLEDRRKRIQNGEDLDPLILLIDEAAQIFTGSGADQWKAKALAKILKLARKSAANVILIGQDGKDIGPSLRALCTTFVEKQSQKKAVFWQDVKDRQGLNEIMTLSGVPETSLDWDTWDEGEFKFNDEDEDDLPTQADIKELVREHEREMMAILSASTDLTQEDIGEIYGVKPRTVRRAKQENDEKLRDLGLLDE